MSVQSFAKKTFMQFFIITTCITLATAILGLSLDPTRQFGYDAFFSPILFGLISSLPTLITYSSKELTLRQMLLRKALSLSVLELILVAVGYKAGLLQKAEDMVFFAITVFIIFLAVHLLSWSVAQKDAAKLNDALRLLQQQE